MSRWSRQISPAHHQDRRWHDQFHPPLPETIEAGAPLALDSDDCSIPARILLAGGRAIWPNRQMGLLPPETRKLMEALAPPSAGADLLATRHAGLARLEPLTLRGERWLAALDWGEASWYGDALIVELRYFASIADAAIAAELTFEREALLN